MTVAEADAAPAAGRPRRGRDLLGWFRSPLKTFLVLAIAAGVYLVCVVPHFAGIDEPAHFYRSYQISTGTFLPEKEGSKGFGGACIPRDVIRAQRADSSVYSAHLLQGLVDPETGKPIVYAPGPIKACPTDPSEGFVTFSTFPSFVPYLPQAASVFVTRNLGLDTDAMLIVARFVVLAMYVALVAVAIARSPRSKWALAAVGLVPVAVYQSASSISHDAFTTAIALVVVSSALRALDPPEGTSTRALVIEAILLSAVLGSVKPMYVVIAGVVPAAAARLEASGRERGSGRGAPSHRPLAARVRADRRRGGDGAVERVRRRRVEDRRRLLLHQGRRRHAEARAAAPALGLRRRPRAHGLPPALALGAPAVHRRPERHRRSGDPRGAVRRDLRGVVVATRARGSAGAARVVAARA